jgi:putative Mg2+ transporter-C (MgtC) family protein
MAHILLSLEEPGHMLSFNSLQEAILTGGAAGRLLLAAFLGGVIGIDREYHHKPSGVRTNLLICFGAALFTFLSSVVAGEGSTNKGQIASNIVQGIGFLGAGLILHTRDRVVGLTSAATVFVIASIGMACGAGLYIEAVLATLITLISLTFIGHLEGIIGWQRYPLIYEVRGTNQNKMYVAILSVMDRAGERLNIIERDSVAAMERLTFVVKGNAKMHAQLLAELRASDEADQVLAFRDVEAE